MRYDWPIRRWTPARLESERAARGRWLARRSDGARLHAGVDLGAPVGTPVVAPENGVVVASIPDADAVVGWRGYGPGVVVIRGAESGVFYNLAHVAPIASEGDIVQRGAQVATVGQLGGPHVHFEVRARLQPRDGAAVVEDCADPIAWCERGEVVRWDGRCPERPVNDARTPRACRPAWRGPRPAPLFPWPTPAPASSPTSSPAPASSPASSPASPARSSATSARAGRDSGTGNAGLVLLVALAAAAMLFSRVRA